MNIEMLRNTVKSGHIEWRKHTLVRLAERNIAQETILETILKGEIIEDYQKNKPFPSCLIFKIIEGRPYHTVVSLDVENKKVYIITVYNPSLDKFEPDYKTRRR